MASRGTVRLGLGRRFLVTLVATGAVVAMIATGGASATRRASMVSLKVRINGLGTIRVTGGRSFVCRGLVCVHAFRVVRGRRVVVRATAARGWKATQWTGACKRSVTRCVLRMRGWRTVAVTFAPPGSLASPYALGTAHTMYGDWRVKVNSATINATKSVEAAGNPPPLPGAQYTLVNLSLTPTIGSGPSNVDDFLYGNLDGGFQQLGAAVDLSGAYPPDSCQPPQPDLGAMTQVPSGQTVTGDLCYEIPSADASTLALLGWVNSNPRGFGPIWLALR